MTKEHILGEIRRTAGENGGEPLGRQRFESETGIRSRDWQRFWARWSEALREAELSRNRFGWAYEDTRVLECFARLTRELGRVPTENDLVLQRHRDSSFPTHTVFRRFGSKRTLVVKVGEHCGSLGGWDDVAALCAAHSPSESPQNASRADQQPPKEEEEFGFVYLLKSARFFKIGRSNSVGRREYELTIQLPEPVTQVHAIRTDDPRGIEAYWHNRFESKRKNGEWFELDAADVRAFKRRKFM